MKYHHRDVDRAATIPATRAHGNTTIRVINQTFGTHAPGM